MVVSMYTVLIRIKLSSGTTRNIFDPLFEPAIFISMPFSAFIWPPRTYPATYTFPLQYNDEFTLPLPRILMFPSAVTLQFEMEDNVMSPFKGVGFFC